MKSVEITLMKEDPQRVSKHMTVAWFVLAIMAFCCCLVDDLSGEEVSRSETLLQRMIEQKTDIMMATSRMDSLHRVRRNARLMPLLDSVIEAEQSRAELVKSIESTLPPMDTPQPKTPGKESVQIAQGKIENDSRPVETQPGENQRGENQPGEIQPDQGQPSDALASDNPPTDAQPIADTIEHRWADRIQSQWAVQEAQKHNFNGLVRLAAYSSRRRSGALPPAGVSLSEEPLPIQIPMPTGATTSSRRARSVAPAVDPSASLVKSKTNVLRSNDFVVKSKLDVKPTSTLPDAITIEPPPVPSTGGQITKLPVREDDTVSDREIETVTEPESSIEKQASAKNVANVRPLPVSVGTPASAEQNAETSITTTAKMNGDSPVIATASDESEPKPSIEIVSAKSASKNDASVNEANPTTSSVAASDQPKVAAPPFQPRTIPDRPRVTKNPHFIAAVDQEKTYTPNHAATVSVKTIPAASRATNPNSDDVPPVVASVPATYRKTNKDSTRENPGSPDGSVAEVNEGVPISTSAPALPPPVVHIEKGSAVAQIKPDTIDAATRKSDEQPDARQQASSARGVTPIPNDRPVAVAAVDNIVTSIPDSESGKQARDALRVTKAETIHTEANSHTDASRHAEENRRTETNIAAETTYHSKSPNAATEPDEQIASGWPFELPAPKATTDGKVSLSVNESDIRTVLEMLAKGYGMNILVAPKVSGTVTANVEGLTPEQTLSGVLKLCGLTAQREGDLIFVFPNDGLPEGSTQLRMFTLDFARGEALLPTIQGLLSPVGNAYSSTIDPIDNLQARESVVVIDTLEALARVESYIMQADQPPRQVMIEAHVLEVELKDDMMHGVNLEALLGGDLTVGSFGLADPIASRNNPLFFAQVDGSRIDSLIDMVQTTTDAKTLASPRVMVVNGQSAKMQVGQQLGFSVATVTQTSTIQDVRFLDTGVVLEVVPTISRDNRVLINVKPKVSSGEINPDTLLPEEESRELETSVMLNNHQGIVIGGLIQENDRTVIRKLPWLGDMKHVGKLFQRREALRQRTEIIIALVPHIVEPDGDGCLPCNDDPMREHGNLEQATSPLFNGPLNRSFRPWEARLPDVAAESHVHQDIRRIINESQ